MNESKQEPEVSSKETSGKEISSHEKMMESKVPQGINESLGFSSVSTDITDARQILLHTLETLAEPENPARDLLASALKVLNKALHTINEKASSVAVQEPSDALGCEGLVTESPCDTLATQETPNVVDGVVNESPCDTVATQVTPNVENGLVTESSCDVLATQKAPQVESGVVTKSLCDVVMSPNVQDGMITVSPCDTLAKEETPHVKDSVVTEYLCDAVMSPHDADAVATQETPNLVDGVVTESPYDAVATQETPNAVEVMITESLCDDVATQETPSFIDGVLTESPCDAVATQETPKWVDSVVTESPYNAVAAQETPNVVDVVVNESLCDAVATQETLNLVDVVVTEPPCDAVATMETPKLVEVMITESPCDAMATIETPNLIDVVVTECPCDAVAIQETPNLVDVVVTESPCDAVAIQETPNLVDVVVTESPCDTAATQETPNVVDVVVTESPCDAVATMEAPNLVDVVVTESPCDAAATQETPNVLDVVVTKSPCDAVATQETPNQVDVVVTESSCDAVTTQETPNVVDVVFTESLCDAVATQETPYLLDGEITESPCDAVATQETSNVVDVVVTESPSNAACEGSEIIAYTCNVSVLSEPLIGVQAFSEENIKLTVERSSSMFVQEPAESFTEDGITNIDAMEGIFSNRSLRSRKRRGSCVSSIESRAHRSRNCSEIWEPVRKSRRLSENTASLCQRAEAFATCGPTEIAITDSLCDAVATQKTPDVDAGVITESFCEAVATQETSDVDAGVVTESFCEAVATQETSDVDAGVVTESLYDAVATQQTRTVVDDMITGPLCDVLARQERPNVQDGVVTESPCDPVARQETPDVEEGVVTDSLCDAVATQKSPNIEYRVVTESPCNAVSEGNEINSSTCSVASEPLMGVQSFSEDNNNLPVERVTSLFVHEPAESFTEYGTTNISDVSAALTVTEFSEVEGTFSNKSLRSRKRRSSSDNSIGSCAHRSRNCSEIWEPPRKSRRLSKNSASLCQRESLEPDEVNATDETMASSEANMTLPVEALPSLDPPELTEGVAGEETTAINESEITTSTCNFAAASELATAEETYSEHDATVPMKKRSYLDLRELTAGVDEDDTTVIDAIETASSSCNLTVASELATAEEKLSGINITPPLEKCPALDVHESSEDLHTEESTNVHESEITASSHNVITVRDLFIAADEYFEGNISLSADKVSLVDAADHAEAIVTDRTTSKDEIEITASVNDVSVAPQGFFGVDGSAEDITLPLEMVSFLDVLKPAEATATDETAVTVRSEVTSSIHGVSAASEVLMHGETPSEAYVTLPVEKLSLLEVHGPVEVVGTGETANLDEVEITACAYDGSVITAEKGLSEVTALPVEDITSPEVHQPTMAVTTDETTNFRGNKIAESTGDGALAVQGHFQDKTTLPAEEVSSPDELEPAKAVATNETTNSDDMEGSLSSRALRLRKRKRAAETVNEGSGPASTSCSVHQDLGEPVRKSKRCLRNSAAETPDSTSKVTIAPAVLAEGPEAAITETAVDDTIKIKAEGIPAINSGAESPGTMGYVHYYLSTAYELLCGAMKRDPADALHVESVFHHSRESTAAGPSQNNRTRRRRVRRVWNGEAFVPEEHNRDHAEPHLRRRRPRRK